MFNFSSYLFLQLHNYKKDVSEITGTLRLVAPDSIFIYNMQPLIKEILHTAPNIRLIVNSLPSHEINQAIVDGTADIGIDCDKGNFPETLVHKSLITYQLIYRGPQIQQRLIFSRPLQPV